MKIGKPRELTTASVPGAKGVDGGIDRIAGVDAAEGSAGKTPAGKRFEDGNGLPIALVTGDAFLESIWG